MGVPYLELAAAEVARFHGDMAALEMRPPMAEPRATESIDLIIDLVARLLESGHAYLTHGTAYFDVSSAAHYGELSHYTDEHMLRLARERGGNPDDPHRRQPLDFVLWQPSLADEPAWRAPFGVGRPGWHIECSAMAMHEHGPTLDLHGGGTDLIFPHHECEIAQSEAITGKPFVKHWLHSAMVNYEGEKMSKSLGNLVFVSDLLKTADPRAIRLALLRHHYRHGFEWYDTDLEEGTALLHRLLAAAERPTGPDPELFAQRVRDAIDDDLDSPRALDALDDFVSAILSGGDDPTAHDVLCELGQLLGVDLTRPIATPH
jgi:L-cysteine:1D-myo-inositol 2-amino-2-deoxy-alpha-D-glucopyranoside ligase